MSHHAPSTQYLIIGNTENTLTLTILKKSATQHKLITVSAYRTIILDETCLYKGIIYNPTQLIKILTSFMHTHAIKQTDIIWWINTSACIQNLIHQNSPFTSETILQSHMRAQHCGNYLYIYPSDNTHFVFYNAQLPQWIIFQYQLIAHKIVCHIQLLTTQHMGLLQLYRFIQGASFRPAKLAADLKTHDHKLESLFTWSVIAPFVSLAPYVTFDYTTDSSLLLPSLGLFVSESGLV